MARGEDGQALSLNLLFERSGNELYYSYGPGNRAPIAEYSGSWLILDGEGGAWDTPRQIKFTLYSRTDGVADLSGIFEVTRRSDGRLEVTHLDGDPLLSGLTSGTLLLDPES